MQSHANIRGRMIPKKEGADYSGASLSWIDRLIRSGAIKAVRLSPKMTRIDGDSLADYLDSKTHVASTPRGKAIKEKGAA